jgi:hypothetical protein
MCCGAYPNDADDEPTEFCRMCDCNPCMCGKNDYSSNREAKRKEDEDREHFARLNPAGSG